MTLRQKFTENAAQFDALVGEMFAENERLRDALRRAADEPNIDKARKIADEILTPTNE